MRGLLLQFGQVFAAACMLAGSLNACAVYYYDEATKVEHVWGVGHLKVRNVPSKDDTKASILGLTTVGASVGAIDDAKQFMLGWSSQQSVSILSDDFAIGLATPDNDLFKIRVGNAPPQSIKTLLKQSELPGVD